MTKKYILLFVFFVLPFLFFGRAFAQTDNFKTTADISYSVAADGLTTVSHKITIENLTTKFYVDSFSLKVAGTQPLNPRASENATPIILLTKMQGDSWSLDLELEKIVGLGKTRSFEILFETASFAEKTGSVWEILIPGEEGNNVYDVTSVTLYTSSEFGSPAYISPLPTRRFQKDEKFAFEFRSKDIPLNGLSAAFGDFQIFDFYLAYHLENPLSRESKFQIAVPPDTAFQKVIYQAFDPKPTNLEADQDGNWLADFSLAAQQKLDVNVSGVVEIYSQPIFQNNLDEDDFKPFLAPSAVWQTDDPKIVEIARKLKTPKAIYDYVSKNLTYDYSRVRPNVDRLGASRVLQEPNRSICTEYTDLFIAIARAAGIPAREVNGYAYSQNPNIEPLSLVADVLHAWPEYWDKDLLVWRPVDPTWASTSGGTDYFTKLDLRHFAFVMHGTDYQKPYPPGSYKLGENPQKDVYVTLSDQSISRSVSVEINILSLRNLPWRDSQMEISIENTGNTAIYDRDLQILFDGKIVDFKKVPALLPFSKTTKLVDVPFSFFGNRTPETLTVAFGEDEKTILTYKSSLIIFSLLSSAVAIFIACGFVVWLIKAK